MVPAYFVYISTAVASIGILQYLWLTILGKVQPNRISFFFWGLFPLIAFFAQSSAEVSSVVWITFSVGTLPFLIVIASFWNPKAYWEIKPRDYILAGFAICAMILWYITSDPLVALGFAIVADFFAGLPTLLKSYTHPHSENWQPFALSGFGFFLGVLAVPEWIFAEYSFVLYLLLMNILFSSIIFIRQKQLL